METFNTAPAPGEKLGCPARCRRCTKPAIAARHAGAEMSVRVSKARINEKTRKLVRKRGSWRRSRTEKGRLRNSRFTGFRSYSAYRPRHSCATHSPLKWSSQGFCEPSTSGNGNPLQVSEPKISEFHNLRISRHHKSITASSPISTRGYH